jgi:hypothetical protein
MDGAYLAAGAPDQDVEGTSNRGSVYIYLLGSSQFTQQYKHSGITAGSSFGLSVALNGNLLAVGAPLAQLFANTSPCVFVLRRTGTNWALTDQIYLPNQSLNALNSTYGMAVALNSNQLMISASGGAEFPNGTGINYSGQLGSVYVYPVQGANFSTTALRCIRSDFPFEGDYFGQSIALDPSGAYILSDPRQRVNGIQQTGQVLFGN